MLASFYHQFTVLSQDTVAPEAVISYDPAAKQLAVTGTDAGSGVAPGPVTPTCAPAKRDGDHDADEDAKDQLCTYLIRDNAGNTTVLVVRVKQAGRSLKASAVSIQYGSAPAVSLAANTVSYEWSLDRTGDLRELEQRMTTGGDKTRVEVRAHFKEGRTATTRIRADMPGKANDTRSNTPGLVLLRLATTEGVLGIAY